MLLNVYFKIYSLKYNIDPRKHIKNDNSFVNFYSFEEGILNDEH